MTAEIIDIRTGKPKQKGPSKKKITKELRNYVNDMVDDYMVRLIHEWKLEGLSVGSTKWPDSRKTFKELGFFIETLRALLHKEFDMKHPMHDVIDNMMKIVYDKKKNQYYSQISYPKMEKTIEFEGEEIE